MALLQLHHHSYAAYAGDLHLAQRQPTALPNPKVNVPPSRVNRAWQVATVA
jgi:hypothetical protein